MELYKKYRPKDFNEIIGNKLIIDSLKSLLLNNNLPHTILFSGYPGTGKTTLARIIKNKINCSDTEFFEINSSNDRGIEAIRNIINLANIKTRNKENKIFFFDEFHGVTTTAQRALFKILEDTPNYCYFILATTNPEQILPPIRSRATEFHLSKLMDNKIVGLIKTILKKEDKELSIDIIKKVSKESNGTPRDALKILDKIIDLKNEDIEKLIEGYIIYEHNIKDLCEGLLQKKSWNIIVKILNGINEEPEKIRRSVLGWMNKVIRNNYGGNSNIKFAALIIEYFSDNYFNTGESGLTLSCYNYYFGE